MSNMMEKLAQIRDRGDISEISYQFCVFLKRVEPECANEVLLGGCLASQRKEEGDVCVELSHEANKKIFGEISSDLAISTPSVNKWESLLKKSICVGAPGQSCPLILDDSSRLYLHKYWKYEVHLADRLLTKAAKDEMFVSQKELRKELNRLFDADPEETDWQKLAAWMAIRQKLTVISGGPGTGKTTTIAKILLLMARLGILNHAALAAPTGKAASRMMESVKSALSRFSPADVTLQKLPDQTFTIHKLLGARQYSSDFRYNKENPLPYDLVIVDEASMVDLALMVKLTDALPEEARLILLGDKDQLASVEAGAILGSICAKKENYFSSSFMEEAKKVGLTIPKLCLEPKSKPLTDHIVLLEKNYRFRQDSGIANLATAILKGTADQALDILHSPTYSDTKLITFDRAENFKEFLLSTIQQRLQALATGITIEEALNAITRLGILCVHRKGPLGSNQINLLVEQLLRHQKAISATQKWYEGKPVMVTRNDYSLELRNGELGVTLKNEKRDLKVFFPRNEGGYRSFHPSRLSNIETAFAQTVHKSQGSEFDDVIIVMPQIVSAISTKELLYTAATRARRSCTIIGSSAVVAETINQGISRSSGLKDRLWNA